MTERLQKVLARGGLGSRRKCEELIAARRVRVNGEVAAEPGIRVDPIHDEVTIDGVPVESERAVHYLLHKPKGFVCTNRPRPGEQAAVSLVRAPEGQRLFTVGRLDEDSSGALLVTNDGAWANLLSHPRYGVPKTYRVTVRGKAEGEMLRLIREGIHLAEGRTSPAKVQVAKRSREWSALRVTLHEGKNRHLRRVFARIGLPVKEILRVAVGSVRLGRLKPGEFRPLLPAEVETLRADASAPPRPKPRPLGSGGRAHRPRSSDDAAAPPDRPAGETTHEKPGGRKPARKKAPAKKKAGPRKTAGKGPPARGGAGAKGGDAAGRPSRRSKPGGSRPSRPDAGGRKKKTNRKRGRPGRG